MNKTEGKIRFGVYPYTYARTSVMRSLLLKKEDYHKLLKMDFNEIARFMGETTYKSAIDSLSSHFSGPMLIEVALNKNLHESFSKLKRISDTELVLLINEYLKRKDIEDIKTIIRGKSLKKDDSAIERSLQANGLLGLTRLKNMIRMDSIEAVLKSIDFIDFRKFKEALPGDSQEKSSLQAIENELDRQYYDGLLRFTNLLSEDGKLFKDFILKEVEVQNILTIIRMKHSKIDKQKIKGFLLFLESSGSKSILMELLELDIPGIVKRLERKYYHKIIEAGFRDYEETGSLIELETSLFKNLLKESILLLHKNPLSIDVILGYMFAKEIEVRNLKIIVKGKELKLKEEFIERQLVA